MAVTAKVKCSSLIQYPSRDRWGGYWYVSFSPDYGDGRNAEWANASPSLQLTMVLAPGKGDLFEVGKAYTLTFEPEDETVAYGEGAYGVGNYGG
jgi:hypothetical protein